MYLARDMELGTFWAIKQLPLSMKKEAELLRRLNHSSLPRMTDYTEQDDKCYLVMEYIKGKSLNEYLKTNNLLSFEEILTLRASGSSIWSSSLKRLLFRIASPNLP